MPEPAPSPDLPYDGNRDLALGIEEAYRVIRARVAAGGPPWRPKGEEGGNGYHPPPKSEPVRLRRAASL